MGRRTKPTMSELAEGASHLVYEVLMLHNTARLLEDDARWVAGWDDKTQYMALIESNLTHARALMDFLCPERGWESRTINARGIFAQDYCTGDWKPVRWAGFRREHKRISTDVAHLSFDRPPGGRNWSYARLRNNIAEGIEQFLRQADLLPPEAHANLLHILQGGRVAAPATGRVPLPGHMNPSVFRRRRRSAGID